MLSKFVLGSHKQTCANRGPPVMERTRLALAIGRARPGGNKAAIGPNKFHKHNLDLNAEGRVCPVPVPDVVHRAPSSKAHSPPA